VTWRRTAGAAAARGGARGEGRVSLGQLGWRHRLESGEAGLTSYSSCPLRGRNQLKG